MKSPPEVIHTAEIKAKLRDLPSEYEDGSLWYGPLQADEWPPQSGDVELGQNTVRLEDLDPDQVAAERKAIGHVQVMARALHKHLVEAVEPTPQRD